MEAREFWSIKKNTCDKFMRTTCMKDGELCPFLELDQKEYLCSASQLYTGDKDPVTIAEQIKQEQQCQAEPDTSGAYQTPTDEPQSELKNGWAEIKTNGEVRLMTMDFNDPVCLLPEGCRPVENITYRVSEQTKPTPATKFEPGKHYRFSAALPKKRLIAYKKDMSGSTYDALSDIGGRINAIIDYLKAREK